jgi:hypothetical protein
MTKGKNSKDTCPRHFRKQFWKVSRRAVAKEKVLASLSFSLLLSLCCVVFEGWKDLGNPNQNPSLDLTLFQTSATGNPRT